MFYCFYPNVTTLRSGLCYRKSVCHLSVVCKLNVHVPYSRDSIFRQYPSTIHFYRASICEGSLGSRNSVRPSVCLLHTWIVTKFNDGQRIFWYHTKGQSLCYSDTNSGWWKTPPSLRNLRSKWPTPFEKRRLRQISAYNVSTVKDSEKVQLWRI